MNKIFTFMRESSVARFLIPAGLILTIFGVIMFVINNNNKDYIQTEATVSNISIYEDAHTDVDGSWVDATYTINIDYIVDNKEYHSSLDNVSKYNVGDKITIYYNPKDPTQITQVKGLILPIIIIVAGLASLIGGIISGLNAIKRYKKMKEQERNWENGK